MFRGRARFSALPTSVFFNCVKYANKKVEILKIRFKSDEMGGLVQY